MNGTSRPDVAPLGDGARLTIEVPSSGPLYEGHFPGRPILPAVGLLDLVSRALASAGFSPSLRGIATLRLRRLVAPGEGLDLRVLSAAADGRVRLAVRRGAEAVADGVVLLGGPAGPWPSAPPPMSSSGAGTPHARPASGLPGLDDLLPHRPPMRLVEAIESEMDGGVSCAVRVPERSAFDAAGSAPALVALEMAAQAAAASEALRRFREEGVAGPRVGYLVGARDVEFTRARVPVGESLHATVRLSGMALPLCTYAFDVARGTEVVARGTLSTWLTPTVA